MLIIVRNKRRKQQPIELITGKDLSEALKITLQQAAVRLRRIPRKEF